MEDDRRDLLRVGDVAQLDWDGSGDRDHTGIVSRITGAADGHLSVEVAEHSPPSLHHAVDSMLADHAATGVQAHYSHLLR